MTDYFLDMSLVQSGEAVIRDEFGPDGPHWLYFRKPEDKTVALRTSEVPIVLEQASEWGERDWVVGFLTYESSNGLNPQILTREPDWEPLAWFARYTSPPEKYRELTPVYDDISIENLTAEWDQDEYHRAFSRFRRSLASGASYQANITFKNRFRIRHSGFELFSQRCGVSPPPYAAYIRDEGWEIASFSPELLFERTGSKVVTKPMKGTLSAPANPTERLHQGLSLTQDPKTKAENIMIVDMVRNDLGSISRVGSVNVPHLMEVESHRSLLQVTSTVTSEFDGPTSQLIRALFPSASITGAPKVETCRILSELESSPRNIYCGSVGYFEPNHQRFNVAIRTALIRRGQGEYGVGGGVVWDSDPRSEYHEALSKLDLLVRPGKPWKLVEAFGAHWIGNDQIVEAHLSRMADSAAELGIDLDLSVIRQALANQPVSNATERVKIRILTNVNGDFEIQRGRSSVTSDTLSAVLATRPVRSQDPNLIHKTTSRKMLDELLEEAFPHDAVLLYDENDRITEFSNGSALFRFGSQWCSPAPTYGVLPGISAARMERAGQISFETIFKDQAVTAEEIQFVNSVVGRLPVHLSPPISRKR